MNIASSLSSIASGALRPLTQTAGCSASGQAPTTAPQCPVDRAGLSSEAMGGGAGLGNISQLLSGLSSAFGSGQPSPASNDAQGSQGSGQPPEDGGQDLQQKIQKLEKKLKKAQKKGDKEKVQRIQEKLQKLNAKLQAQGGGVPAAGNAQAA